MASRPRIAILGGGVGSVTAAFHLSKPGWETRFESITLYQQGWRLGGKGASGRGPGLRIEEHGLHIWLGFYENAFRMMRECHEELDRYEREGTPRWPIPFRSVEESFSGSSRRAAGGESTASSSPGPLCSDRTSDHARSAARCRQRPA